MSNPFAIAAATATLRALLIKRLEINDVTTRPPDKAREGFSGDQVNLFLYQTMPDAAWRNMNMPGQLKPGETGQPPLPLILSYLLTAYSDDLDDVKGHMLLGRAMSVLHDHPLLDAAEIQDATGGTVPDSDLHQQVERVRITLQPLPVDELSKLWTAFQTQYRTSAAYQVSVVLIESQRSAKTPLPVLERGKGDRGVTSQADVTSPFPTLLGIGMPEGQSSPRLGDVVTLKGLHLDVGTVEVRVSNPHLAGPGPVVIGPSTAKEIQITLTDDPTAWVAGFYTVAVTVTDGDDVRSTNELPLTIAPRITTAPLPLDVTRAPNEKAEIDLACSPEVRPGQRAALLIGDREVPAEAHPATTGSLKFLVEHAPLGEHFLRLRIDGVDSLLVLRPPNGPPVFDSTQKVKIHD
jgi:hypothetical protein